MMVVKILLKVTELYFPGQRVQQHKEEEWHDAEDAQAHVHKKILKQSINYQIRNWFRESHEASNKCFQAIKRALASPRLQREHEGKDGRVNT